MSLEIVKAAVHGRADEMDNLLNSGSYIIDGTLDQLTIPEIDPIYKTTALNVASQKGWTAIVMLLLKAGANASAIDPTMHLDCVWNLSPFSTRRLYMPIIWKQLLC
jgi:ankyrin repeat protein